MGSNPIIAAENFLKAFAKLQTPNNPPPLMWYDRVTKDTDFFEKRFQQCREFKSVMEQAIINVCPSMTNEERTNILRKFREMEQNVEMYERDSDEFGIWTKPADSQPNPFDAPPVVTIPYFDVQNVRERSEQPAIVLPVFDSDLAISTDDLINYL